MEAGPTSEAAKTASACLQGSTSKDPTDFSTVEISESPIDMHIQMLRACFDLFDVDGSGQIDSTELGDALRQLGDAATPEELQALMGLVDKDNSGDISFDEFCELMGPRLKDLGSRDALRHAFELIDTDGGGSVSQTEVRGLLIMLNMTASMSDKKLSQLFREAETDESGDLSFEEFEKIFDHGGVATKELKTAINTLCTIHSMRKSVVAGFSAWGAVAQPVKHAPASFIFDAVCKRLADRWRFLRPAAALNGTMPAFTKACSRHTATRWFDAFLRGAGQVVFANNPLSGAFIIAALFAAMADGASSAVAVCGLLGLLGGTAAAVFLQMDRNALQSGLFGYNGCLAGLGAATFLVGADEWDVGLLAVSALLGVLTTVLQLSLGNLLVPTFRCPPFTLAFNVVNSSFILAAASFSRFQRAPFLEPALLLLDGGPFSEDWPCEDWLCCSEWVLRSALVSVGQIFLCESAVSGALIIAGVFFCSRIGAFALWGGALAGVLIALALGAPVEAVGAGLWGYDASLGAAAVCIFFYPNRKCCVMALVCAALCVLLDGTFKAVAAPLGMPVGTVPFCLSAVVMMLTQGGVTGFDPVPIADVSTAEDHLITTASHID